MEGTPPETEGRKATDPAGIAGLPKDRQSGFVFSVISAANTSVSRVLHATSLEPSVAQSRDYPSA